MKPSVLQIAVPSPLHHGFDYLPPEGGDVSQLRPGMRLRVPFGRRSAVGVLLNIADMSAFPRQRLRRALEVLDPRPIITTDLMALACWASAYYHHPIGEVLSTVLPVALRKGGAAHRRGMAVWRLTRAGHAIAPESLRRAKRQADLLAALAAQPDGLTAAQLRQQGIYRTAALSALCDKGWIERIDRSVEQNHLKPVAGPALDAAQQAAVTAIQQAQGFSPMLLQGVTGSGKTEVYLRAMQHSLARDQQTLVLVPEIGLTPQLVRRFEQRLAVPLAVMHSGMTDRERLDAWLAAADGSARVILGTRSAVFTPLARPGLFIVDEEHDPSLKQQEGFRYSARDLLIWRARHLAIPVVLGSATPSLESLHNAHQGRYRVLVLPERAAGARAPHIQLLDVRAQPMDHQLSRPLITEMGRHLEAGGQVLLFLNRRGYAPTLICHDCGWVAECHRCDAHLVLHQAAGELRCHHCGSRTRLHARCPACGGGDLRGLGSGTERVERALRQQFPGRCVLRIDRDNVRGKGRLADLLTQAREGDAQILLGTQMLAKGHHFPGVTLVGILDTDQGLFSADFRSGERMAQMLIQVAGRAGRADRPGRVLIQTHHPDHPLLRLLVECGYDDFARAALSEREAAGLPPFSSIALLRAEAVSREAPETFLTAAREQAQARGGDEVALWGPVPAPMERRQGRFRAQLMLVSQQRRALQRLLNDWVPCLAHMGSARRVRWSLDVDPIATF